MRGHGLLQKAKAVAVVARRPPGAALFPSSSSSAGAAIRRCSSATVMAGAASASDVAAIMAQKRALRSKARKDLRALLPSLRSQEDCAIQNVVMNSSWFKSSARLCAYISCDALREVDTSRILSEILNSSATEGDTQPKRKLYVPRVEDKNSHMRMLCISRLDDLVANSMNILEPSPVDADGNQREDVMLASQPVDMFLLPGLAFDRSGRRLGRGGGYYDTLLRKYQELATDKRWKQPLLVALAYSTQIIDDGVIPIASHDVSVDALVSPSGVIPISTAALERMR